MRSFNIYGLVLVLIVLTACFDNQPDRRQEADVVMRTDSGDVFIKLYDVTPIHKENFIKLTKEGFYDGIAFHRIINRFMVQVGDPRTKEGGDLRNPQDDAGYKLPAEIVDTLFHIEGKVAAARYPFKLGDSILNPDWSSSSSQFYVVTGDNNNDAKLDDVEQLIDIARQERLFYDYEQLYKKGEYTEVFNNYLASLKYTYFGYSDKQREIYKNVKGTPHLDLQYTIFGEVVQGMDIVKKIEVIPTIGQGQPQKIVRIQKMMMIDDYIKEVAQE